MSEQMELFDVKIDKIKRDYKFCTKCRLNKPLDCFSPRGGAIKIDGTSSLKNRCKECHTKDSKIRNHLLRITPKPSDDYECPICLRNLDTIKEELNDPTNSSSPNTSWNLDHNHEKGTFRGWLCSRCNSALGWLGDNVDNLERGLKYLQDDMDKNNLIDNK